jgi:ABC-type antimicrobial peptide transport system permease subunit
MSAVPAGYEAFSNMRRKSVTLLTMLLATSMVMGIFVYVDSYSVYEWDNQMGQVGPIAMSVEGPGITVLVDDVLAIDGVTVAESIEGVHRELLDVNVTQENGYEYEIGIWGLIQAPNQSYIEAFPDAFTYLQGRPAESATEIAVHEAAMRQMDWELGDAVNFTYWIGSNWERERTGKILEIVGVYSYYTDAYSSEYYYFDFYDRPVAVVTDSNIFGTDIDKRVDLDIDRSQLSPFDARASLTFTQNIAEEIKRFDNWYPEHRRYSDYNVNNRIGNRISYFMSWVLMQRISQIGRTTGVFLLLILVLFLTIRHNVNERKFEMNMLMSRGASEGDLNKIIFREIIILSALGTGLGLFVGAIFSRIASMATGFFQFNPVLLFSEPFLITIDSIIIAVLIGFTLPIATYLLYRVVYKMRQTVTQSTGKLAKLSKGLRIIRWDVVLLSLSILLILLVYTSDIGVQYNPFFGLILAIAPLTIFISLGSLTVKLVRNGAGFLSRHLHAVAGEMSANIGVRRIGRGASSAGPAILVLVLAISLSWTNSVIGASLPVTKENHARFAFGGDLSFHLDSSNQVLWDNFTTNVSTHPQVKAVSHLSVANLFLSAGASDQVQVVAMDPERYANVGYDYLGIPLENSSLEPMLDTLSSSSTGAIITEDIAEDYELSVGGTLRGFTITGEDVEQVFVFNIIGITPALSDATLSDTGTTQEDPWWWRPTEVGSTTIWVNRNYMTSQYNLVNNSENILCTRVSEGANTTAIIQDILNMSSNPPIRPNGYASVSLEVSRYLSQTAFQIDRSVDTMLTVATTAIILGGFVIYAFEGIRNRRREIALLRAMGADRRDVLKVQAAEMLVLMFIGLILLIGYSPLLIVNTLMTYSTTSYIFPVSIYAVIPYSQLGVIFIFFTAMVSIFIIAVAALGTRVRLSEALNAAWAETGIMWGEQ